MIGREITCPPAGSIGWVRGERLSAWRNRPARRKFGSQDREVINAYLRTALKNYQEVRILCQLDGFERLTLKGLVADFKFGYQ
jgi:hypothetical protein